jgi:ABC-type antimicrobial peptide transport system permease subunit
MSGTISQVNYVLDVVFSIIIAMCMFLAFFALMSAMSANIMNQTKEIAIL